MRGRNIILANAVSFASALALAYFCGWLLPSQPGYPSAALAASFAVNLCVLATSIAFFPNEIVFKKSARWPLLHACISAFSCAFSAHLGLGLASIHQESFRVFLALFALCCAQISALFALYGMCSVIFGTQRRIARSLVVCVLFLLASALFWTREPIQFLARMGGDGPVYANAVADGVMRLSPPAAVASVWHQSCDAARLPGKAEARRFDLVHGPLTYVTWIGSYQAVAVPEIMPSGGGDFYARSEWSPGVALLLLLWSVPLIVFAELLLRAKKFSS